MANHNRKAKAEAQKRGQRKFEEQRAAKLRKQLKAGTEYREGLMRTLQQKEHS